MEGGREKGAPSLIKFTKICQGAKIRCICLLVLCIAWLLVRFLMGLICLQGEEVRLGIYLRKENARPCSVQAVLLVPDFVSALFLYFYVRIFWMANAPHVVLC